jgi:hypothetical protein
MPQGKGSQPFRRKQGRREPLLRRPLKLFCVFWMVEMMRSENHLRQASKHRNNNFPVKLEIIEDSLEEEHAPLNKRSKVFC